MAGVSTPPPLALYVHIPFCGTKCPYCDFNTYAATKPLMPAYADRLPPETAAGGAWPGPGIRGSAWRWSIRSACGCHGRGR